MESVGFVGIEEIGTLGNRSIIVGRKE